MLLSKPCPRSCYTSTQAEHLATRRVAEAEMAVPAPPPVCQHMRMPRQAKENPGVHTLGPPPRILSLPLPLLLAPLMMSGVPACHL